jgi:hypothetical protein
MDSITLLGEEALFVQLALCGTETGRLQWASMLLSRVLADVEAARLLRQVTGTAVLGGDWARAARQRAGWAE